MNFLLYCYVVVACFPFSAKAESSAVVIAYHSFGNNEKPNINIRLDQFEAHLQELKDGKYNVISLPEIIDAFNNGIELPERTVAITIDSAYISTYTEAFPSLKKAGFPFTLFIATHYIDKSIDGYMSWEQIREMVASGVTVGSHMSHHINMAITTYQPSSFLRRQESRKILDAPG